jgi:non-haem Fe2+, alpha-ketoglutarate-dependent halogenase
MGKRLSAAEVERFTSDGVLFPIRAYAADQTAMRLAWLEEIEASRAGRLPPAFNAKPHLLVPWLWDMVHDPAIVDPVEDLLGPDLLCWGTSFISKQGMDAHYVTWHQDATHWSLTAPRAVTAWVAFTPATRANGCMRMIRGSNRRQLPHRDNGDHLNMLGRREEVIGSIDDARAVDVVLAPGEMSLHDPLIIHSSEANTSASRRTGFAVRYIPSDVAQRNGQRNSATLVRGRDYGNFELERPPEGLFHPEAMRRHRLVLRRGIAVIFGHDAAPRQQGRERRTLPARG